MVTIASGWQSGVGRRRRLICRATPCASCGKTAVERDLDVTAVQADAAALEYDAEFDLALICYIHVLPSVRAKILKSVTRALKPGGLLLWRSFEAGMEEDPGFDQDLLPAR